LSGQGVAHIRASALYVVFVGSFVAGVEVCPDGRCQPTLLRLLLGLRGAGGGILHSYAARVNPDAIDHKADSVQFSVTGYCIPLILRRLSRLGLTVTWNKYRLPPWLNAATIHLSSVVASLALRIGLLG
jgi:hypothetical protein